jgi:glutathione S-transferase
MKLYYSAGSCSTSCHIILEESGLRYEAVEVDWDNSSDPNISVVTQLNPLGTLPVLVTDDGKQLDQNLAIHTYISDLASERKLLPPIGTYERAVAMNWLSFVAADLHKSVGALFFVSQVSSDKAVQDAYRKYAVSKANDTLKYMNFKLEGKDYLMGKAFTPADAYAFVVTGWTQWLDIPLTPYPNIQGFMARVAARPAVVKVLKAEGLDTA